MLTLNALDKLIYNGMTEDSGEMFTDIAHHVRNAAWVVYAAMAEQNDALMAVGSACREQGYTNRQSIGDVESVRVYIETRTVLAVLKVTDQGAQ
jgi:hypothetical protein